MRAAILDIDHTIYSADHKLHGGVAELLALFRTLGIDVGAISSRDHRAIVELEEVGIRSYFRDVLCADKRPDSKTAAALHSTLARFGVRPDEAVLISHAHADILLGKDAGLAKTVGISHGADCIMPLQRAGADHVIDNFSDVLDVLE